MPRVWQDLLEAQHAQDTFSDPHGRHSVQVHVAQLQEELQREEQHVKAPQEPRAEARQAEGCSQGRVAYRVLEIFLFFGFPFFFYYYYYYHYMITIFTVMCSLQGGR